LQQLCDGEHGGRGSAAAQRTHGRLDRAGTRHYPPHGGIGQARGGGGITPRDSNNSPLAWSPAKSTVCAPWVFFCFLVSGPAPWSNQGCPPAKWSSPLPLERKHSDLIRPWTSAPPRHHTSGTFASRVFGPAGHWPVVAAGPADSGGKGPVPREKRADREIGGPRFPDPGAKPSRHVWYETGRPARGPGRVQAHCDPGAGGVHLRAPAASGGPGRQVRPGPVAGPPGEQPPGGHAPPPDRLPAAGRLLRQGRLAGRLAVLLVGPGPSAAPAG